jgi:hypothetical protein
MADYSLSFEHRVRLQRLCDQSLSKQAEGFVVNLEKKQMLMGV